MGYMMDAPRELGPMVRIIREMGQYKYDPAEVFRDFVDYSVGCFLLEGDKQLAERLRARYGKDYGRMAELMRGWMTIMNEQIVEENGWYDALGMLYEYLASQYKKSYLGQFFTPPEICDLSTRITVGEKTTARVRVNDPACGSGRMLLSFNAYNPGGLLYGEDLDPVCAKMTALNMAIHGCQGQVFCCNSLTLDDWRFGYQVNYYHRFGAPPVPHLWPIRKEQSVTWQHWQLRRRELEESRRVVAVAEPPKRVSVPTQLSLF